MSWQKTLVIGGARSGKTAHALSLCEPFSKRVYVATAHAGDEEMISRISKHQKERGAGWLTVEAPLELPEVLVKLHGENESLAGSGSEVVLVDCLTLWLSNLMLAERDVSQMSDALVEALYGLPFKVVMVSNEVGQGIVPEHALGRAFRDAQGLLNQQIAKLSDVVELVVAGLPMRLKP